MPKVSVIMPCYNAEALIAEAIDSVLKQTYSNKEIIVINDGSTDNSMQILESFNDKIIVIDQQNKGPSQARNAGLEIASGDYIAFLDSDDYWDEHFLQEMVTKAENSGVKLVYCGWQHIGNYANKDPFIPPDYEQMENKAELMIQSTRWPIHGVLTHRSVFDFTGFFDPQWTSCMDFAIWVRAATHFKIALVPRVLAYYRHHEGEQITKSYARIAINHWRVQNDFLKQYPEFIQKISKKRIRFLTTGELLRRGYVAYWRRDLESARKIFRIVMQQGYGSLKDWKYMLPAILPQRLHETLISRFG